MTAYKSGTTAAGVHRLRDLTDEPLMLCRRALQATGGDLVAAQEWIRLNRRHDFKEPAMTTKQFCADIAHSLRRLADRIEGMQHPPVYVVPQGTRVYDMDADGAEIRQVMEVDGLAGEVVRAVEPIQAGPSGEIIKETLRFAGVEAVRDAGGRIERINCYGRQA